MGFDSNGIRLLIKAKRLSVNFENVLTIGRQGLHVDKAPLQKIIKNAGIKTSLFDNFSKGSYAETFLHLLGSKKIDSMDASDYEGATMIHDLNLPVAKEHKSKYSVVIDGGSLEHIFNFPMAIKNCMEMVQPGGHYIGISPTNNFLGHGFYQFSPELYYRLFTPANGFEIVKMYFYINQIDSPVFEIADPAKVNQRVTLVNSYPSYLFIIAKKNTEENIFQKYPQQSDYENILWENRHHENPAIKRQSLRFIRKYIPSGLKKAFNQLIAKQKPTGISHDAFFKKINDV